MKKGKTSKNEISRGISPELLVSQVRNTMPYLFEGGDSPLARTQPGITILNRSNTPENELSHFDYFSLCLSAHFLTVGTPVPTDVDNQIRKKLWAPELPLEVLVQMADLVLSARLWPHELFSTRYQRGAAGSAWADQSVSGHLGEWFTVAAAAYGCLRGKSDQAARAKCAELLDAITDEVRKHSEIFGSLWRAGDGLGCLKAAASLAHNFGDLDRVIDLWELSAEDPLRKEHYKLGILPFDSNRKLRHHGRIWSAGELYKAPIDLSSTAMENHRHFALRKPKVLRQKAEFRLPNGPVFDDWGTLVLSDLQASNEEAFQEVVQALVDGWKRLPGTIGYARALQSIFQAEGFKGVLAPLKDQKGCRRALETSRESFEKRWNAEALRHLDEIPSRAE